MLVLVACHGPYTPKGRPHVLAVLKAKLGGFIGAKVHLMRVQIDDGWRRFQQQHALASSSPQRQWYSVFSDSGMAPWRYPIAYELANVLEAVCLPAVLDEVG